MPPDQHPIKISLWAVAFLDLLGYRNVLSGLDRFPFPAEGAERDHVVKSFTKAIRLRRRLLDGISDFMKGHTDPAAVDFSSLPPQARVTAETWRSVEMFKLPGPDHIVLGCSLAAEPNHFPIRGVYALMMCTASAMLIQLAIGADDPSDSLPLRGGIDVAPGGLLEPEQFLYSPALARAYELESDRARYPRTLIGPRLVDYIHATTEQTGSLSGQYSSRVASIIKAMLFKDRDGSTAFDFFGEAVRERFNPDLARQLAERAWRYAKGAQATASANESAHITEKYDWLVEYMRPRLSSWGVGS